MTERLPLEALAALPTVTALLVSNSGNHIAFYADWTGRFELYVQDLRSGERRQLTNGEAPKAVRAAFIWSHDDAHLYFSRDENGDERQALFELEVASGKVRALQHDPQSMDYAADVHPDGRLLVNSTRGGMMNVHIYDPAAPKDSAWTVLTRQPNTTMAAAFSPDGTRLTVTTNESPDLRNTDGYVLNADGSGLRRIFRVREGSRDSVGHWHPDGQRVAVSSDASGSGRVGLLTVDTGEVRWLTSENDQTEEMPGRFSPDGRWLSALRNVDSTLTPVLYDTGTGHERTLKLPAGIAAGTDFALGGTKLLLQFTTTTTRPEVLLYDLEHDRYEVLIPADYGELDPADFVAGEYVRYPTTDGLEVPAILYRPRDAAPGQKLPALVHVHGGPTAQFFRGFDAQAQFLADRGHVVLSPNIRGSTGYGVAWRDANLRDWGGRDLEDVAAGAGFLKTLPEVDPERLGIFGGSFGGYMSFLAAVKKPELFKVSVPIVGISDLRQLHEDNSRVMPQLSYYFRTMMGDPEENAELWRDRSAVTHAARLKAHMFMMHGTNDPRCPINQARGFRDALLAQGRQEGRDFEYVEFDDEGHGAGDIAGKTRSYRLMADYFARRL
ncbi:S9 family peptidase [Deinococcus deserti]|uniref:Putative Dipeptidyl aminopeptidase n=1 Tax=Deinococcus deserti (strain DSM 17065 / CIP 109153 / LMG 22923 / VCD115) TaxID=546414 RepID=C1CZ02_DEIDV|nr:S9 family peptidase [Deinococcus deserti]ACO45040.1 putative Dipeptidyl aminopeptidase [Deinococcus deserti VCD115]